MLTIRLFFVVLVVASLGLVAAQARVPDVVNYQGTITDSDGMLLTGNHDLVFKIYGSESGDDLLWAETHFGEHIEGGYFSVILGEVTTFPLSLFDQPNRWIGIKVDQDIEMTPRMRFTSSPYSMRASVADTALNSGSGGDGHSLDAADGDPVDALYVDNSGNVEIGTAGKRQSSDGAEKALDCQLEVRAEILDETAVEGMNDISQNYGKLGTEEYGVFGYAHFLGTAGVRGEIVNGNWGQLGGENAGAFGTHANGNWGRLGGSQSGAYGIHFNGNYGRLGSENFGTYGYTSTGLAGVHGENANGNWGRLGGENYAIYGSGDCYFDNGTTRVDCIQINGGCDFSERFDIGAIAGSPSPFPGMVVSIDPENPGNLTISQTAYDRKVAGVISGAGGVKTGMLMGQTGSIADGEHPVALSGRVYVMVDASFGSIQPGDLLTTSDTPGHAMKATSPDRSHGAVIGKAMTSQETGKGLVLVLVNLQ